MKYNKLLFIWITFFIIFVILTVNVLSGNMKNFDYYMYMNIERWINPVLTHIMIVISSIGEWYTYIIITLTLLINNKTRRKIGMPVSIIMLITEILNNCLKIIFAVSRPDINRLSVVNGYSYPSGHVMNGTVFIGMCIFFVFKYSHNKSLKYLITVLLLLYIILIGNSRIYLGVHNMSDVLGGYLTGILVLIPVICCLKKYLKSQ